MVDAADEKAWTVYMDGLPPSVENLPTAADAWRVDAAAFDKNLVRPEQGGLVRERSPDAVITDMHFFWNADVPGTSSHRSVRDTFVGETSGQ
ncbi:UDP-glycosyltransferase 73E1-like [Panicum miliaceum]|uniref:UDP-glycosyltransferase 73E1-like n=1 Tax=Panicum miliaceum TaxID=4540 RepID=A0A3L6R753_PANMI|nr:UDP-glycosyltransferase 73E1-like [Panicum miliaceum]